MSVLGEKSRGQINYDILDEGPESGLQRGIKRLFRNRRFLIILVVVIALLLRLWASLGLSLDFDEPVYMTAAGDYARLIQQGDWQGVIDYPENNEHPPLMKLLYALVILALGPKQEWWIVLSMARFVSAIFGTLAVLLVTLFDPLAGLFLALQTLVVKYTSQTYLEAIPLFASIGAVFAMLHTQKNASTARPDGWFWLSASALGLTAAGKYSYFPILFVILYLAIWEKKIGWKYLLLYLALVGLTFWLLDPALWRDPVNRLLGSVSFHGDYSQSQHVLQSGYPWYQPFLWVSRSWGARWHPEVFFNFGLDAIIFILALVGLPRVWKERRFVIVWLVVGMLALLLWPTRWPQYTLIVLPAFCLAAADGARNTIHWIREKESYWGWLRVMLPNPSAATLAAVILFASVAVIGSLVNAAVVSLNRLGWSQFNAITTPLPSNMVYQVMPLQDGRVLIATDAGAAIWKSGGTDADTWQVFTPDNSGLPDTEVLSLAQDAQGRLWFGTRGGLASYDGQDWQTYNAEEIGLAGDDILSIEPDAHGGLWVGTNTGAAYYDGQAWTAYTSTEAGLLDDLVLSMAVQPQTNGEAVWFGTRLGLSRFDPMTQEWTTFSGANAGVGDGGVADLMIDSQGRLWASQLGGGISVYNGNTWRQYRTANAGLPTNMVQEVYEYSPGQYWIATGIPNTPGGLITSFDENNNLWVTYRPGRSGYSGAETVSITQDPSGQLWFGTLTAGIDRYLPRQSNP